MLISGSRFSAGLGQTQKINGLQPLRLGIQDKTNHPTGAESQSSHFPAMQFGRQHPRLRTTTCRQWAGHGASQCIDRFEHHGHRWLTPG